MQNAKKMQFGEKILSELVGSIVPAKGSCATNQVFVEMKLQIN
jgi:hypothetical protein